MPGCFLKLNHEHCRLVARNATTIASVTQLPVLTIVTSLLLLRADKLKETRPLDRCPTGCSCDDVRRHVTCRKQGWAEVPRNLGLGFEWVDLSWNQLALITREMLERGGLSQVVRLNLSANGIEMFLDLSHNNMTSLSLRSFEGCELLLTLDLSYNYLKSVDGVLDGLKELSRLNLQNNRLTHLTSSTFKDLKSLRYLVLANNKIHDVDKRTFKNLDKLIFLSLRNNPLSSNLPRLQFASSSLSNIHLSNCHLSKMPKGLPNSIKYLQLSRNEVKKLDGWSFEDYPFVNVLVLENNYIREIGPTTFDHMVYLQRLWLEYNDIHKFPPSLPPSLQVLSLENNFIEKLSFDSDDDDGDHGNDGKFGGDDNDGSDDDDDDDDDDDNDGDDDQRKVKKTSKYGGKVSGDKMRSVFPSTSESRDEDDVDINNNNNNYHNNYHNKNINNYYLNRDNYNQNYNNNNIIDDDGDDNNENNKNKPQSNGNLNYESKSTIVNFQSRNKWSQKSQRTAKIFNIKSLFLSKNVITTISVDFFRTFFQLRYLDLSSNKLTKLENLIFKHLNTLKFLDLSGNPLIVLDRDCFLGLKSLVGLNLGSNYEVSVLVDNEAMTKLPKLKSLVLDGSFALINTMLNSENFMKHLKTLTTLSVIDSNLIHAKVDLPKLLPSLRALKISGLNWHCGRDLLWLLVALRSGIVGRKYAATNLLVLFFLSS
ncbi:hypothetical protein HELRODRAFT_192428 [Helobdella robusta]|uniref:LRRNT domain-containing protein n=1 Tax=Helobdella robusta TaxID=6412 RepID=T1FTY4_HELRO|nr:hypothetical protein HELRODRAFT_192428 [Helobdella robusta]ESO00814.1 hypothetical protein HELRODRAFT_192428 [Helobdella robusta]